MQRLVSNWLCVSTVFYKKTMEKKLIFFSSSDLYICYVRKKKLPTMNFFFVLRLSHLAEKSVKQKIKKTLALFSLKYGAGANKHVLLTPDEIYIRSSLHPA